MQSSESSEQNLARTKAIIHQHHRQAAARGLAHVVSGLLLCFVGLMVVTFGLIGSTAFHVATILLVSFLFPLFRMFAVRQEAKARSLMEQIDDVRLIGPLAQLLDAEKSAPQPSVASALRRSLPKLKASDAHLLSKEQRACLYRILSRARFNSWNYDKELILAILKALEQIGDKEALPAVQKLAKWSSDNAIREAANNCLPLSVREIGRTPAGRDLFAACRRAHIRTRRAAPRFDERRRASANAARTAVTRRSTRIIIW